MQAPLVRDPPTRDGRQVPRHPGTRWRPCCERPSPQSKSGSHATCLTFMGLSPVKGLFALAGQLICDCCWVLLRVLCIPATSQLDWLISTTTMIVLSWFKATRELLKSHHGQDPNGPSLVPRAPSSWETKPAESVGIWPSGATGGATGGGERAFRICTDHAGRPQRRSALQLLLTNSPAYRLLAPHFLLRS
jgi:hypothetical protein